MAEGLLQGEALVYLVELFLLYLATASTRLFLTRFNSRARLFSLRQEHLVFCGPPIILLKAFVSFRAAEAYYTTSASASISSSMLTHRFNLWLPMCFGYMFELLHRPLPIRLALHHAGTQVATYYYWYSTLYRPQLVMFGFSQIFFTIIIYGIGFHGLINESINLVRHLAPKRSRVTRTLIGGLAKCVWVSFAWQWITVGKHVAAYYPRFAESLTLLEQVAWASSLAVFLGSQFGDIQALNEIARRFGEQSLVREGENATSPRGCK